MPEHRFHQISCETPKFQLSTQANFTFFFSGCAGERRPRRWRRLPLRAPGGPAVRHWHPWAGGLPPPVHDRTGQVANRLRQQSVMSQRQNGHP